MSLEDLMGLHIEVTSVTKHAQPIASAPAAIFVLTNEDIRRSGARSLPEALRMVPGISVARINSSTWAVSARGFNGRFNNKMLVLIDGRSVYSTTFSGVYWDVQDVLLEDIERIEIIRGPGAVQWGSNAVNGVINVITRTAAQSQGAFLETGIGTEEKHFVGARFGGTLGDDGHFRVYGKSADHEGRELHPGDTVDDDWHQKRAGFRADWSVSDKDTWTVQGDVYRGHADSPETAPIYTPPFVVMRNGDTDVDGGNLLSRWTHVISEDSGFSLQAYYDVTHRHESTGQSIDTIDLSYQHHARLGARNEIVFGGGYRRTASDFLSSPTITVDSAKATDEIFSAFVQDNIAIVPEELVLSLGTQYENNDYTGSELQPSARIVWTPDETHTVWGAVSRAVRTPSRLESEAEVTFQVFPDAGGFLDVVRLFGNDDLPAEELIAYELGVRFQPDEAVGLDLALFYNDYDSLSTLEGGSPFFDGTNLIIPLTFDSKLSGVTWGGELAADWNVSSTWKLRAAYSLLMMSLHPDADSSDTGVVSAEGNDPENQFHLRSLLDLTPTTQLDLALYYVDSAPALNNPSYIRGDARLGWRPAPWIDISLVAQSLFHDGEPEPGNDIVGGSTDSQTAFYLSASWRF